MLYIVSSMSPLWFIFTSSLGHWLFCRRDLSNRVEETAAFSEVICCKLYCIGSVKQHLRWNCYINHSCLFPFQVTLLQQSSSLSQEKLIYCTINYIKDSEKNLRAARLNQLPPVTYVWQMFSSTRNSEAKSMKWSLGSWSKSPKFRRPFQTLSPRKTSPRHSVAWGYISATEALLSQPWAFLWENCKPPGVTQTLVLLSTWLGTSW